MSHDARGRRPLAHTADAGIEAWGPSFGDACAESAVALFEAMGRPGTLVPSPPFEQRSEGVDRGDAVVRLLTDLLGRFETEGRFVTSAECVSQGASPDGGVAVALRCAGGVVDRTRERGLAEVKAVTYHGLRVEDELGRVVARVYLDL